MAKLRTYQCDACEGKFEFMHHPSDEPPPAFCPLCGVSFAEEPEAVMPNRLNYGGSNEARSVDMTYRQLEADSAARAEAAGDPSLKITDLKDNLREGDVAAKPSINNAVTQYAEQTGHSFWQGGDANIQASIAAAKAGGGGGASMALEGIQKARTGQLH